MRIDFVANPNSGNGFYRAVGPMTALAGIRGHEVDGLTDQATRWSSRPMRGLDVLFIHRSCEEQVLSLARAAKDHGAAIVWDNDDDMGAVPPSVVTHRQLSGYSWEKRLGDMRRMFRLADLVTTPSRYLAQRLLDLGAPRTAVIENHVPSQALCTATHPHDGVNIGWVAGLEHQTDVEQMPIKAALQQLLDTRAEVRVISIGLRLGLEGDRYEARGRIPLLELSRHTADFDIGIAPLADVAFNRSRSNIKLKEYAAAGVPWLASRIGPYAEMGEQQGGRLVPDHRWYEEISRLLDKPRERRKLAKQASRWAATQTLVAHVGTWEAALSTAIQHARAG